MTYDIINHVSTDQVECAHCGIEIDEAVSHLGCTDGARGYCDDCHGAVCTDRDCHV